MRASAMEAAAHSPTSARGVRAARAATELSSEKEADGDAPGPAEDAAVRQRGEAQRTDLVARCRRSPLSALECAMAARDLKSLGSCRQ